MPSCSCVRQPVSDPDVFRHAWLAGLSGRLPYKATGILPGHLPGSGHFPFVCQKSAPGRLPGSGRLPGRIWYYEKVRT